MIEPADEWLLRVTIISHRREVVAYTRFVCRNDAEYDLFSKALSSRSDGMRTRHGCPAVHTRRRHARIYPCVSKWRQQQQEAFFSGPKDRRCLLCIYAPFSITVYRVQGSRGLCGAHPVRSMCNDDTDRSRSMTARATRSSVTFLCRSISSFHGTFHCSLHAWPAGGLLYARWCAGRPAGRPPS